MAICEYDFYIDISVGALSEADPVEAYITPMQPNRIDVQIGQEFTARGKYIIGEPPFVDAPFKVKFEGNQGHIVPRGARVVSISPESPNLVNVEADEEQDVVVTAVINGHVPRWEEDSDDFYYVWMDVSAYQPVRGEVPTPEPDLIIFTTPEAVIANLTARKLGNGWVVEWDLPEDDEGNKMPVDIRIIVSRLREEGSEIYDRIPGAVKEYPGRVVENIGVFWDLLKTIIPVERGQRIISDLQPVIEQEGEQPVVFWNEYDEFSVGIQIKPGSTQEERTVWNRDSTNIRLAWPVEVLEEADRPIPNPRNVQLDLSVYSTRIPFDPNFLDERWRLQWEQPFWLGDPTVPNGFFHNYWPQPEYRNGVPITQPTESALQIDYYEFRTKRGNAAWSNWNSNVDIVTTNVEWPDQLYASPYHQLRCYPFGNEYPLVDGVYQIEARAVTVEGDGDIRLYGETITRIFRVGQQETGVGPA